MWKILVMPRARKDLRKLDKRISGRIIEKIKQASLNPKKYFHELVDSPYSKLRIGDYRVIAVVEIKDKEIEIRKIGHRKNIYKKI